MTMMTMSMMMITTMMLLMMVRGGLGVQPMVQVGHTPIYGFDMQVGGRTVWLFRGIRYGESPEGAGRFLPARPYRLPSTPINATKFGYACASVPYSTDTNFMREDCLFLNVHVPRRKTGEKEEKSGLPVMIWLYGEGFLAGSGNIYEGQLLAAEGMVIVVTLNYRLGVMSFLSTEDNNGYGNGGLWDQRMVLEWVNRNIRYFGGDVTRITLAGESMGAASTSYHLATPDSAKLFQRAIMQSGNHQCPWASEWIRPVDRARQLARALKCDRQYDLNSNANVMRCLREVDVEQLIETSHSSSMWLNIPAHDALDYIWTFNHDDHFLPPTKQIESSKFTGPILLGVTNREGAYLQYELTRVKSLYPDLPRRYAQRQPYVSEFLPTVLDAMFHTRSDDSLSQQTLKNAVSLLECAYNTSASNQTYVNPEELENIYGDLQFYAVNREYLNLDPSAKKVYMYYFDYDPGCKGCDGMNHFYDTVYTFGFTGPMPKALEFPDVISADERKMSAMFRTLLTNFAKTGDPNTPVQLSDFPTWPAYTKKDRQYLSLSLSPEIKSRLKDKKVKVWLEMLPALLSGNGNGKSWHEYCEEATSASVNNTPFFFAFLLVVFAVLKHVYQLV